MSDEELDKVFAEAHEQGAEPYVPRMNRRWVDDGERIKAVDMADEGFPRTGGEAAMSELEVPRCPWCGGEGVVTVGRALVRWWKCRNCEASGPYRDTPAEAAVAIARVRLDDSK